VLVVFAAESDLAPEQAREKLSAKNADLLVLNDITASDAGFEVDTNRVTLFARDAGVEAWPLLAKAEVAERIVARVASMLERVGSDG
jgi:phosphopantothenoylcysteine decarboxylase/phosphopantothenate--cysteine ligase